MFRSSLISSKQSININICNLEIHPKLRWTESYVIKQVEGNVNEEILVVGMRVFMRKWFK